MRRHVRKERTWVENDWEETAKFLKCSECFDLNPCQRHTIRLRWLEEAKHYDQLWRRYRVFDYALRIPLILLTATVPALAILSAPKEVTAAFGLAVAILSGLDQSLKHGARWRQLRQTATLLKREGWAYLEMTGAYCAFGEKDHKTVYRKFLDRLEEINTTQTQGYIALLKEHRPSGSNDV